MTDDQLPALVRQAGEIEHSRPPIPRRFQNLGADLAAGQQSLDFLGAVHPREDCDSTVGLIAYAEFTGDTQAAALQAAVDWLKETPKAVVQLSGWARVPGPTDDTFEWHYSFTYALPDADGETSGAVHHADRRKG